MHSQIYEAYGILNERMNPFNDLHMARDADFLVNGYSSTFTLIS